MTTTQAKNIFDYAVSDEQLEEARKAYEETPRVGLPAHRVPQYIRMSFDILPGHSETAVVDRIREILDKAGLTYSYAHYSFQIKNYCIKLNVYRNEGPYIRTRMWEDATSIPLPEGELNFVVELEDLSRRYIGILRYIVDNYRAETISPLCMDDYPCYYSSYEEQDAGVAESEEFPMDGYA